MRQLFIPQTDLVASLPWENQYNRIERARGAWRAAGYAIHRCHLARYTIKNFEWCHLHSDIMGRLAGNGAVWKAAKSLLIQHGILQTTVEDPTQKDYEAGKQSIGYRLGPALADVKWKLSENAFAIPEGKKLEYAKSPEWPGLTIDKPRAREIIQSIAPDREWSRERVDVWQYKIGEFSPAYTISAKCGRATTDANQIPRETRDALLIHGRRTVELDIRNCHPLLLATYYGSRSKEKPDYQQLAESGQIYEHFAGLLGTDRDGAKDRFTPWINGHGDREFGNAFKAAFPELEGIVRPLRGPKMANKLMRMEADIVLPACAKFEAVSIHDGIRVEETKAEAAHAFLRDTISTKHGLSARITGLN